MPQCRHCGTAVTLSEPIPRDAECSGCGKDLRACVQCRHYDTAYNNACRETMADPVVEKERRNFCEYFSFSTAPFQAGAGSSRQADARAKLEGLFGGGGKPTPSADARKRLEDLFKKPDSSG
jgi:hypothetical protein